MRSRAPFRITSAIESNLTREEYGRGFRHVKRYIEDGESPLDAKLHVSSMNLATTLGREIKATWLASISLVVAPIRWA